MTRPQWAAAVALPLLGVAVALGATRARREPVPAPLFATTAATDVAAQKTSSGPALRIEFSDKPVSAPAFSVAALDGTTISSADWHGKVVLVNFWATWCGPCRQELPVLIALQERYRGRLLIVGLSIDERPPSEVKQFVEQNHFNYPVGIADQKLQHAFGGVSAVPSTFVINTTGGIVQRHVGLIQPAISEQEVRSLAGLPTEAHVDIVKDTGQVLLANAAFATEIPGVSLSGLTAEQKGKVLSRLNTDKCTCGCDLTLAQCRINDPSCKVSLPLAQKVAKDAAGGR